jgi:hypothetical protein
MTGIMALIKINVRASNLKFFTISPLCFLALIPLFIYGIYIIPLFFKPLLSILIALYRLD